MTEEQSPRFTRRQLEERRLTALEWIVRGEHTVREIADHFGVSIYTVRSWKTRLKAHGSLKATVASGPQSRLTADQQLLLRALLQEDALHHGFPDDRWTMWRVRDLIGQTFDVWYHKDHVGRVLRQLGITLQGPDGRSRTKQTPHCQLETNGGTKGIESASGPGVPILQLDETPPSMQPRPEASSPEGFDK